MSLMSVIFRMMNKAGTAFIEPATADKQLANDHDVRVSNQIQQPTRPSDTQPVSGTVSLDAASIAALQHVTAAIEAFPVAYPLPTSQIAALVPQLDALTNDELRASAVPVSTGLTQPTTPSDTQPVSIEALPLPLGAAAQATLEEVLSALLGVLTATVSGEVEIKNDVGSPVPTADDYATIEHAPDQTGVDTVRTFALAGGAADFVMVDVDTTSPTDYTTYRARATLDGSTPTGLSGFVCRSGSSTYLPFPTAGVVKLYLPAGTIGAVQVARRG